MCGNVTCESNPIPNVFFFFFFFLFSFFRFSFFLSFFFFFFFSFFLFFLEENACYLLKCSKYLNLNIACTFICIIKLAS